MCGHFHSLAPKTLFLPPLNTLITTSIILSQSTVGCYFLLSFPGMTFLWSTHHDGSSIYPVTQDHTGDALHQRAPSSWQSRLRIRWCRVRYGQNLLSFIFRNLVIQRLAAYISSGETDRLIFCQGKYWKILILLYCPRPVSVQIVNRVSHNKADCIKLGPNFHTFPPH